MPTKIYLLISFLFITFANASNEFLISKDGLYSKDGKLLNREIPTKPTTFSYSLHEQDGNRITLYRDTFLNSSSEQCAMQFNINDFGEYHASYAICFDELISTKENKKVPALKLIDLNNLELSYYNENTITQGEYIFENKELHDLVLFDVSPKNQKSTNEDNKIYCNYYIRDYNVGISTDNIRCYRNTVVKNKTHLHQDANIDSETRKYLIPGDIVIPLDEKEDQHSNKWIYILYQGKKDIKMWIDDDSLEFGEQIR